jgi:hypothetical protein
LLATERHQHPRTWHRRGCIPRRQIVEAPAQGRIQSDFTKNGIHPV